jgi:CHASE3 domain sensor protein
VVDTGVVDPQPATPAPRPNGQGQDIVAAFRNLADGVRRMRAVRFYRRSSALMRWIILVVLIGGGIALVIAAVVSVLVSAIPSSG